jgi:hypothetical protein
MRHESMRTRAIAVGAGMVAAAAVALLSPPTASAGEYTVHTCRFPDGSEAGTGGWQVTEGEFTSILSSWESCPEGAYQLSMSSKKAHPADHYIRTTFLAPPATQITAYSLWRSAELSPDYNYRYYEIVGDQYVIHDKCYDSCTEKGSWSAHVADENLVSRSGLSGVTGLDILLTCGVDDASTESCPAVWPAARFALHRADITLRDDVEPVIQSVSGPLVDPSTPLLSGKVPISISASDQGGGVYQAVFQVDGKQRGTATIDANEGACAAPFTRALPCRTSASGTVKFNSRSVSDGAHQLKILVTDPTGTNAAAWGPIPIRTSNGRCSPNPRGKTMRLKARIAGRKGGSSTRIRYGGKPRAKGRLSTPSGDPVANAEICVSSRARMSRAELRAEGTTRTDANGRFSFRLGRGPSRRVFFVHRLASGAAADRVNVKVRAPVRVHPSDRRLVNGQTVTLSGKLRAGPFPRRGVVVELQADRGRKWQTFGTTRTNRKGRYRFKYRFTRTTGVQRYNLRARVPAQATYPYSAGASKPVTVNVSG